jgi:hypothetical protein
MKKKKKKKDVNEDQHIEGYESKSFNSKFKSIVKKSCSETWRDCKRLQGAYILKILEEKDMFCGSYELLKMLCRI